MTQKQGGRVVWRTQGRGNESENRNGELRIVQRWGVGERQALNPSSAQFPPKEAESGGGSRWGQRKGLEGCRKESHPAQISLAGPSSLCLLLRGSGGPEQGEGGFGSPTHG